MLGSMVLFNQQINQSVKQRFPSLVGIMVELEKPQIRRELFL